VTAALRAIAIDVAPGVTLRLAVPEGAREEAESALPAIDVAQVPGARVAVRRGFVGGAAVGGGATAGGAAEGGVARGDVAGSGAVVRAACVLAPSDRWAPGLEELLLGRATVLAISGLGAKVERWEPGAIEDRGGRFEQVVVGRASEREAARIAHVLAFVGPEHEALLCSVACADASDAPVCGDALAASGLQGALTGPPSPSWLVRAVLFAAEKPYETAAGVLLASAAIFAALLARRPRVPGRRF
jgi:hypothetical protein